MPANDLYLCIDIEASGPVPGLYNLVSIGGAPVTFRDGAWRPGDALFYTELKPIAAGFDPGAMKVHGLSRAHLEQHGIEAAEAMRRLTRFVEEQRGGAGRAVFVGHNAVFDWSFIAYYYALFGLANPFGYKGLDTKSLAMGRLGIGWFETSKETLEKMLRLPPQDTALTHRADYDAQYQALILCGLLNRSVEK